MRVSSDFRNSVLISISSSTQTNRTSQEASTKQPEEPANGRADKPKL